MRPRLLDVFCGAGGAAMGYHRAGFDVVGVDLDPKPLKHFPFESHCGDAIEFLAMHGREFDVIHASPPCQGYLNLTRMNASIGRESGHRTLIPLVRELLQYMGKPWVIENVADAKAEMPNAVRLCGTGFGLPLRRHRLFSSSLPIVGIDCQHHRFTEKRYWTSWRPNGEHRLATTVQVYGNAGGREHWPAAMGIDWMTPAEMTEAIPPAYTERIGIQLIEQIGAVAA